MTHLNDVPDADGPRDPDAGTELQVRIVPTNADNGDDEIEKLVDYLAYAMSAEETFDINEKLRNDRKYASWALPLIQAWSYPVHLGDVLGLDVKEGKRAERRDARLVRRVLRDRHSPRACQAQWNKLCDQEGKPRMWIWKIWGRVWRPSLAGVVKAFALVIVFALSVLVYNGYKTATVWRTAFRDAQEGKAVTPGANLSAPTTDETKAGEKRKVTVPGAVITMQPESRFVHSTAHVGAIDGEAEITVTRAFSLVAADVAFLLLPGRYRVTHPVGGPTRIVVDSGKARLFGTESNRTHWVSDT